MNAATDPAGKAGTDKEQALRRCLARYGRLAVAFSGGVDSTYLADVAHETLDGNVLLLIADSASVPRLELAEAMNLAIDRGWRIEAVRTREFENPDYLTNDGRRCYHCRRQVFAELLSFAAAHGYPVMAYGSNADDGADQGRSGTAAARELGVVAPLEEAGLTKAEVRQLSARRGLPTAAKAAFACLSSRVPAGTPISVEVLARIERVEAALQGAGFRQYRARHHGVICRIEVEPDEFDRFLDAGLRDTIIAEAVAAGYRFVALDLAGYSMGSVAGPARAAE